MYRALEYFIQTSFHEDWDVSGPDDAAVIAEFVERDPGKVGEVIDDIRGYLAGNPSESDVRDYLISLGCAYDPSPDGLDDKQWLARIVPLLEAWALR